MIYTLITMYTYNPTWKNIIMFSTEYCVHQRKQTFDKLLSIHVTRPSNIFTTHSERPVDYSAEVSAAMPRRLKTSTLDFESTEYFRANATTFGTIGNALIETWGRYRFFSWQSRNGSELSCSASTDRWWVTSRALWRVDGSMDGLMERHRRGGRLKGCGRDKEGHAISVEDKGGQNERRELWRVDGKRRKAYHVMIAERPDQVIMEWL